MKNLSTNLSTVETWIKYFIIKKVFRFRKKQREMGGIGKILHICRFTEKQLRSQLL